MNNLLKAQEITKLFDTLQQRFSQNSLRHAGISWEDVVAKLDGNHDLIRSLEWMEETGGEPDVVGHDDKTGEIIWFDCSPESPSGRRSLCYDREALESRSPESQPVSSIVDVAREARVEILSEEEYRFLQTLGEFDLKTSSWIKTPQRIRDLGGALFCDRRYDTVFVYHNGAPSYYAARGFRAVVRG